MHEVKFTVTDENARAVQALAAALVFDWPRDHDPTKISTACPTCHTVHDVDRGLFALARVHPRPARPDWNHCPACHAAATISPAHIAAGGGS
jgi:hypothetical protein